MQNLTEFSVSDLSQQLKKTIEDTFSYVKIRGEISGFKRHSSGHLYFSLKDDKAVMNAIMWKGTTSRLNFAPEDGLEVLATGKVTTFAGRSQYQIIVDNMDPAGTGALMALLEKRKAQFTAEGLFDPSRKKKLPYLPKVIAILTSETGAVIRDILHRLKDRYMPHVLLLPIAVQGDLSAKQVSYGIRLFNKIDQAHQLPRPDIIIVARGGGSIEDLWSFNEEIVVRAIAASDIPVISAVGHETDFTLCDFVADLRAPTPTAAAEMAVPVKNDLLLHLSNLEIRLLQALQKNISQTKQAFHKIRLPQTDRLMAAPRQKFDYLQQRLPKSLKHIMELKKSRFQQKSDALRPDSLKNKVSLLKRDLNYLLKQKQDYIKNKMHQEQKSISSLDRMLEVLCYKSVLKRGFTAVKDNQGQYLSCKPDNNPQDLTLEFYDGTLNVKSV